MIMTKKLFFPKTVSKLSGQAIHFDLYSIQFSSLDIEVKSIQKDSPLHQQVQQFLRLTERSVGGQKCSDKVWV